MNSINSPKGSEHHQRHHHQRPTHTWYTFSIPHQDRLHKRVVEDYEERFKHPLNIPSHIRLTTFHPFVELEDTPANAYGTPKYQENLKKLQKIAISR